jgi:hypothetical protein
LVCREGSNITICSRVHRFAPSLWWQADGRRTRTAVGLGDDLIDIHRLLKDARHHPNLIEPPHPVRTGLRREAIGWDE